MSRANPKSSISEVGASGAKKQGRAEGKKHSTQKTSEAATAPRVQTRTSVAMSR